jgi:two-component system, OmpR family, copper resistance phosphate regulon response regulator CusR
VLSQTLKPSLLVVDDDLDTLTLLRTALSRGGYQVSTASCWQEVTDRLHMAMANQQMFDVIILDLMMPERSGFDVLNSLKIILDKIPPVIILSARYSTQDMVKASDMGATKYLVKPVKREKLLETVAEVIKQNRQT